MRAILAQIHYIPDSWKGNAHTYKVRDEFIQLYQYKVVRSSVQQYQLLGIYFVSGSLLL